MTKKLLLPILIVILVVAGWYAFVYRDQSIVTLKEKCLAVSNTGWAPVGPLDSAPIGPDGNRIMYDSPLVEDGYTCYCHTPNTAWNGEECVAVAVK